MVIVKIRKDLTYSNTLFINKYDGISPFSTVYNLGIDKSFPLGFNIFLILLSDIFHNLTVLSLVVKTYKFFPY